jgi:hypothetical protein
VRKRRYPPLLAEPLTRTVALGDVVIRSVDMSHSALSLSDIHTLQG